MPNRRIHSAPADRRSEYTLAKAEAVYRLLDWKRSGWREDDPHPHCEGEEVHDGNRPPCGFGLTEGPSGLPRTLRPASSGRWLATGSSSSTFPPSTKIMVTTAVTGLVIDDILKILSRLTASPP